MYKYFRFGADALSHMLTTLRTEAAEYEMVIIPVNHSKLAELQSEMRVRGVHLLQCFTKEM